MVTAAHWKLHMLKSRPLNGLLQSVTVLHWDCPLLDDKINCVNKWNNIKSVRTEESVWVDGYPWFSCSWWWRRLLKSSLLDSRSSWDASWSSHQDPGEVPWQLPSQSRQCHPTYHWQESRRGLCQCVIHEIFWLKFLQIYPSICTAFLTLFLSVFTSAAPSYRVKEGEWQWYGWRPPFSSAWNINPGTWSQWAHCASRSSCGLDAQRHGHNHLLHVPAGWMGGICDYIPQSKYDTTT